jgi:sulfopyruvate decarboxylase TPP-binding subunit
MQLSWIEIQSRPLQCQNLNDFFHGVIRRYLHRGTEEQAFDIIAAVKLNGQISQFLRQKTGPANKIQYSIELASCKQTFRKDISFFFFIAD